MSIDTDQLNAIGRVWPVLKQADWIEHAALAEHVAEMERALLGSPSRSVLLVGAPGSGKTTALRALGRTLQRKGWTFFEASAAQVMAGQMYIGQIEGQVRTITEELAGQKALWVIPNFHELVHAGRHQYNPVSVLDQILPLIERGTLRVVGEVPAQAYEQLVAAQPRLRMTMETVDVPPLDEAATREIATAWAETATKDGAPPLVDGPVLREALALARQYLSARALPGSLFGLLRLTRSRLGAENPASPKRIELDDVIATVARMTGLPLDILDDRAGLDVEALEAYFHRRVLGQEEAVQTLVDRVAMIKAGLTDPSRPAGVFLFVGPTGTGKTEIVKALASYLFGSADRMIRLDMSEFQTPDTLDRLVGGETASSPSSLVDQVRKQPFSVILLDEFEKAAAPVWDLFLQVFDDGRLTDRRGNPADFRHAIVILTSNLGAAVETASGIGFGAEAPGFQAGAVEQALAEVFRPEFLNRLDRIVTFRPLSRATMRTLLHNELKAVLERRGFRRRQWAVEWDESAIEFLLARGFTLDLGARPLKRAIERYLLAPLARTIVAHAFPEGDQFLFIRADGDGLEVEFVDPDADALPAADEHAGERSLEAIALDAHGTREEMALLRAVFERVEATVGATAWVDTKAEALEQMATPGFWDDANRFAVLSLVEHMDRIEAGLATAASLLDRLAGRGERERFPADLVRRLAHQLYLVGEALAAQENEEPRDAFVLVEGEEGDGAFAQRVGAMYRAWAEARRMRLDVIEERADPYRLVLAVSGFGAHRILYPETGLHVWEAPKGPSKTSRATARVRIVAQPETADPTPDGRRRQVREALAASNGHLRIVRRYREAPSPLVRDTSRGWRTGRLDLVLGGDFDLIRG